MRSPSTFAAAFSRNATGPGFLPAKPWAALVSQLFVLWALLDAAGSACAFTTNDANTIFSSYNSAFYVLSGTNAYFANNQTGGVTYFWGQAEEIECVIDAYEWTSNATYKTMITNLLNGFINNNGSSWTYDIYNDDILWACMAFARGGQDTGNANYITIAKNNFDAVYARAWDTNLGGGLYWNTTDASKNACVNGPGAIAAYLLYQYYGGTNYLYKSTNIYYWERSVLFNTNTGCIYDNISTNGTVSEVPTTYNQGTFLGAANFLGQLSDATLAANYTMNSMTSGGILPQYGIANNNSGFNAIFIRWMARFMKNQGLQSTYQTWLQNNANAAWNVRRAVDDLSWCQWLESTPDGTNFDSWDCISSVEALQAVNPTQSTAPGTVTLTASDAAGASSFSSAGNWSSAAPPAWSNNYVVAALELRTPANSVAQNFAGSSLILTNAGAMRLTATGGAVITVGTSLSIFNGIVSAWTRPANLNGSVILQSGGGVFDPQSLGGFTVNAAIGGSGGLTVASDNDTFGGTLYLAGNNTYSGGTVINGPDTVTLTNFGTLGASNGSLSFNNSGNGLTIPYSNYTTANYGTLNLNGVNLEVGNLTGGGGKILNNAASGIATLTIGCGNGGGGNYQGTIQDHSSGGGLVELIKVGTGSILLSGSNTYSGGTLISGGTLQLGDGISANGSVGGGLTNNAALIFANPLQQTFSCGISGSGAVTKSGSGTLIFTATNTYAGGTTISAGVLQLGDGMNFNSVVSGNITDNASLIFANIYAQTNSGVISGSGSLTQNGPGTLLLSQYETFTGATVVNGGILAVDGNNDVSSVLSHSSSLTINSGASVFVMQNNTLFGYGSYVVPVYINAGGILTITAGCTAHIKGVVTLHGGTLASTDAGLGADGTWNLDQGTVATLGGQTTSTISAQNMLLANPTTFNIPPGASNGIDLSVPGYFYGGALVKAGQGTLVLSGTNTYSGTTTVSNGTLALSGSGQMSKTSLISVMGGTVLDASGRTDQTLGLGSGQTLKGSGNINGNLNAGAGSIVNPGDTIGALTVQNQITLQGLLLMELNRTNVQTCDQLNSTAGAIAAGGTLSVTNLGQALQAGDTFQLFNIPVSGFANVILPGLSQGLSWSNQLAVNGSIQVAPIVSTVPTSITAQVTNNELTLSWPVDHTGWTLQSQTNNLGTNWVSVGGSTTTNQITIAIDPANSGVFYRLVYP